MNKYSEGSIIQQPGVSASSPVSRVHPQAETWDKAWTVDATVPQFFLCAVKPGANSVIVRRQQGHTF